MIFDQTLVLLILTAYIGSALTLAIYVLGGQTWAKRIGAPLAFVGCIGQFIELIVRYQTSHIWPLTNLYGSLSLFSAMSVAIFLAFAVKYKLWQTGALVLALAAGFLAYGLTWNEGYLPPVPALQSYWIKIHVPLVVSSYAAFLVAFVTASLHLLKSYSDRFLGGRRTGSVIHAAATPAGSVDLGLRMQMQSELSAPRTVGITREGANITAAAAEGNVFAQWLEGLPSAATLDVMTYRIVAVGLPLLTVGVITGAMWAKEAWGAYWQWDPKETAALVCWIVYACYMHLHTRSAWRGTRSAWIAVGGFGAILFCYLGVNIWISGLHSYKM
ncbi:MAG TPA: c-type cytochrome biogenesis protein CcsB [Candidatus Baltobacteraceae bacterium]|jgi:cytochrome c-type biogenesis protein CcsB|nr:c-type cytochrome biogenesis protein CcsB [Candidatus Baltobacteraceae bacterium]